MERQYNSKQETDPVGCEKRCLMRDMPQDRVEQETHFLPSGDTALTVQFGEAVDRDVSIAVVNTAARIDRAALSGVVEIVPTFRSLLIHYDPLVTSADTLISEVSTLIEHDTADQAPGRRWRIPACYDGDLAPDIDEVAERAGLSRTQVIDHHASQPYHVYMLGFLPGYPYMGDLPQSLHLPRRQTPRVRVPAGSVAITMGLTAVYPYESPGGWHLIGRTPIPFFDLRQDPPALLRPGDTLSFNPVTREIYDRVAKQVENHAFDRAAVVSA